MNPPHLNTNFVVSPLMDIEGFGFVQPHLTLITWEDFKVPKTQNEVRQRVMHFHKEQGERVAYHVTEVARLWEKHADTFVQLALAHFQKEDIPKKTYICYPTIWPLIVRDPERGRVSFPVNEDAKGACAVLAHEFLHELFFHHLYRVRGDGVDMHSKKVWDISEIFNVLILNTKEWQRVFPFVVKEYDEHKELLQTLKPIWEQSNSLDAFLEVVL